MPHSPQNAPQPAQDGQQWILDAAREGKVICNIGQVEPATARHLDKLVKAGKLAKWRGYWYPEAGANFGIGPLKTCWGLPEYLACPVVSNHSPLNRVVA